MFKITSFADFMAAWARLIAAVSNHQQSLPDLSGVVAPLESVLEEARGLDAGKAAARSELSQAVKRTQALIPEGRAAAARLRGALIAHYGNHNEALTEFGIAPVRTRRVSRQPDPPPPSPPVSVPLPE